MLSPNQIKMQSFTAAGRGAYRAAEVDAFLQKIYVSYSELLSENSTLKKKFASLASIIEEYNAGKNAIATAIVKAQTVADQTVSSANASADEIISDAKAKAQAMLSEKAQQAEEYAKEKKQAADEYFAKAETELQRIMADAEAQSAKYAEEINAKAEQIIADANEKASKIVSAAFKDANEYRKKADDIIAKAKVEVETTKNSVAFFKDNTMSVLAQLLPLLEQIELEEFVEPDSDSADTEVSSDLTPEAVEVPKFELKKLDDEEKKEEEISADEAEIIEEEPADDSDDFEQQKFVPDIDNYVSSLFEGIDIPGTEFEESEPVASEEEAVNNLIEANQINDIQPESDAEEAKPNAGGFKFRLTKDFDIFDD